MQLTIVILMQGFKTWIFRITQTNRAVFPLSDIALQASNKHSKASWCIWLTTLLTWLAYAYTQTVTEIIVIVCLRISRFFTVLRGRLQLSNTPFTAIHNVGSNQQPDMTSRALMRSLKYFCLRAKGLFMQF